MIIAIPPPGTLKITTSILDEEFINLPSRMLLWKDDCTRLRAKVLEGVANDMRARGYKPIETQEYRSPMTGATMYLMIGVLNAAK